ncbi:MAG: hypothetical protein ABI664_22655 [bacterium]
MTPDDIESDTRDELELSMGRDLLDGSHRRVSDDLLDAQRRRPQAD